MKYNFYILGCAFIILVAGTGIHIGFYTTTLIIQYAILTMTATLIYNQSNPIKEAISLAFLTVFLNSFYWEIHLHLAELFSGPPHIGMVVQIWRLIPVFWFRRKYVFDKVSHRTLAMGLLFSLLLTCTVFLKIKILNAHTVYPVIRLGCLLALVKTVTEADRLYKDSQNM